MNTKSTTAGDIVLGRPVFSVRGQDSVLAAARHMTEHQIGAVPVLDDAGHLLGIFSERDLMTRVVAQQLDLASTQVSEVMTKRVAVLGEESTYREALAIMDALHIRHLPVMVQDRVAGCISLRDLHQADIDAKDREIEFLDDYIERVERAL